MLDAVLDGGQHEGDVVSLVVAEVDRVGVADGPQQVVGELVEPAEQGVQRAEHRVEVGDLPGGVGLVVGRPHLLGRGVQAADERVLRKLVVGHAQFSFVGIGERDVRESRHGTGDRQTMAGGAVAESRSGANGCARVAYGRAASARVTVGVGR